MKHLRLSRLRGALMRYVLLGAATAVFTLPMLYMISTSLRPNGALYEYPLRFFPRIEALTLENYDYILHQSKFYLNFLNSALVSVSTVALAAAIASVSIFNFLTAWEEYPRANTVINDNSRRTLPIAIAGFFGQHQFTQWGCVFAVSVLTLIPVVLIFILCQRFFVQGLTAGSVKG